MTIYICILLSLLFAGKENFSIFPLLDSAKSFPVFFYYIRSKKEWWKSRHIIYEKPYFP
jgi:hypothetical protein